VGGLDPLFEDEQGYLIRSGSIQIQPDDFTKQELMLMVMSANYWINSNLTESAKHALLKISSLDAAAVAQIAGESKIISPNLPDHSASQIQLLIQSISERIFVKFSYRGSMREIAPLKLENLQGFWYLTGLEGNLLKRFKVIRFETSVELSGKAGAFDHTTNPISENLIEDVSSQKIRLIAKIRIGKCNNLRRIGEVVPLDLEWDKCEIEVSDQEMIIREVLWNGDDIQVLEPENVREIVLARLRLMSQ
jgi:proteasome accessory factor B